MTRRIRNYGKSKTTAVILAVLLSFFTWLYTYKDDAGKFWAGLFICLFGFVLAFIPNICVWIWSIVDTASKDSDWYEDY